MAVVELDPIFVKALKFLHSKSRDSADQLKQLLDDAIAQRKGHKPSTSDTKSSTKLSSIKHQEEEKNKKREAEKRNLDKLKQDISSLSDEVPVSKKPRRDSPQASNSPSRARVDEDVVEVKREEKSSHKEKEKERGKKDSERKMKAEKEEKRAKDEAMEDSDEGEKSIDADDFAFGLGIACVVCNRFDVASGNQLVECQECHTLYHQECHRPPVTEQDVNDPRFVWYCSRCTKTMKKLVTKPSKSKTSSVSSSKEGSSTPSSVTVTSSNSSSSSSSSSSSKSKSDPSTLFTFRRVESKTSTSKDVSNSSGNRPLSGLASLAANLSGKSDQGKASNVRSDSFSKSLLKSDSVKSLSKHDKHDQTEKVSLLNTSKGASSSKPAEVPKSGGGIKLGVDIFKNLPKVPEPSKSGSKSSQSSSKQSSGSSSSSSSKQASGSSISSSSKQASGSSSSKQVSGSSSSKQTSGSSSSKQPSGSSSSSSKQPTGSSSSSSSKQSSASANTVNKQGPGGASSVVNADKRLQMMKKKAAAKLHEKRASLK